MWKVYRFLNCFFFGFYFPYIAYKIRKSLISWTLDLIEIIRIYERVIYLIVWLKEVHHTEVGVIQKVTASVHHVATVQ
jgi:hypothetical protein